jgi:pimeloyl-ACP methyl ester carboxylesterase
MRSRLLERGAAGVSVARLHLPDWAGMAFVGMGPAMLRGARAIREARRATPQPVLVVGHSAGGIVARLAMAPVPLDGRCAGVADDVACLVTLGTPHLLRPSIPFWRHPGLAATEFLQRVSPGAAFAPTTQYLTVGSTYVLAHGRAPTNPVKQAINLLMRSLVGETPGSRGDGIVGNDLTRLDGVRHVELPDVLHGTFGGPWYGDASVIDRWWPEALDGWRRGVAAREGC